ncbi:MAG: cyclase family protein, partial [Candidatus Eisenbacteria bacterium]
MSGGPVIDISPRLSAGSPVWPGDTPLSIETAWSPESGDSVTVCKLTMSPHTGAHADAPLHVGAGPGDAASLPLEAFWGPCVVVDVVGLPVIDGVVAARAGYEIVAEIGVAAIRARSQRLTSRIVAFAQAEGWPVNSPLDG